MKSIELFAGAGGLALGTSAAGFRHVALLEWDRDACETLRFNAERHFGPRSKVEVVEGDVRQFDFRQFHGELDLVSGGPPCQPFSIGGKHLGFEDERNMFPEAVRAIRDIQPQAFMFENVKGLLRASFANYFSYIIHQLRFPEVLRRTDEDWQHHLARLERRQTSGADAGLSYNVVYQVLNAADFGVAQRRARVLVVGIRADRGLEFSFPAPTHEEDSLLFEQWVTGEYWDRHRIRRPSMRTLSPRLQSRIERIKTSKEVTLLAAWRTVRDAIGNLPGLKDATDHSVANHVFNPGARSYKGHDGSPYDYPAKTLKAGDHGVPGGENTLRDASGAVRYFSVRECARIQSFPDDWVFCGSWTETMRQLGNAVPVDLAAIVARKLARDLRRAKNAGSSSALAQPQVITRR